jgi:hypothetical protein
MSEFDKLKGDAQKLAQDHPDQVEKGEQAVEDKLGLGQDDDNSQQAGGSQQADGTQSGADQDSGQQNG